jgi:hypothetical protein
MLTSGRGRARARPPAPPPPTHTHARTHTRTNATLCLQLPASFHPAGLRLRFTKGVNKTVILGLVDELLSRKEVNIW